MSKRRDVLAQKHKRHRLPVVGTIAGWLLLDRVGVAAWGWGVWWTLVAIVWVAVIYAIWAEDIVERTPKWEDLP